MIRASHNSYQNQPDSTLLVLATLSFMSGTSVHYFLSVVPRPPGAHFFILALFLRFIVLLELFVQYVYLFSHFEYLQRTFCIYPMAHGWLCSASVDVTPSLNQPIKSIHTFQRHKKMFSLPLPLNAGEHNGRHKPTEGLRPDQPRTVAGPARVWDHPRLGVPLPRASFVKNSSCLAPGVPCTLPLSYRGPLPSPANHEKRADRRKRQTARHNNDINTTPVCHSSAHICKYKT